MSRSSDQHTQMTFYLMAGSVSEQFVNLLQAPRWIHSNNPTPAEIRSWPDTLI